MLCSVNFLKACVYKGFGFQTQTHVFYKFIKKNLNLLNVIFVQDCYVFEKLFTLFE